MSTVRITAPALFEHQKAVVNTFDNMQPGGTLVVKSARQRGKSMLLMNMLLRQSINYPNTTSILVEPSWAQAKRVFRQITKACKNIPVIESSNAGDMIITFYNGSEVQFLSGAQKVDSVRGATVSKNGILALDEAAFLKDDYVYHVLPFRNANKAKVVAMSTPLFRQGYFYEEYKGCIEGLRGNYLVDFNDYDTSMLYPEEQQEHDKATMPALIYMTEVLGEFIDAYSTLFGDINKLISVPDDKEVESLGIDWGTGQGSDYTAIVGFNKLHQMTFCDGWNDIKPTEQINNIVNIIKRTRPSKVTVETNSIGEIYFDNLKTALKNAKITIPVKGFETTNDSKRRIIENLVVACQNESITILDHPLLKLHLSAYEVEATRTGKITYNGQNNTHDDFVIATAIAYDSITRNVSYVFGTGR
jgi:hypothetical protein